MPLDNSKLKKLYDILKSGGYKEDYSTFVNCFAGNDNYPNRKKVYDFLRENGAKGEEIGNTYEDFMKMMYTPPAKKPAAAKKPAQNNANPSATPSRTNTSPSGKSGSGISKGQKNQFIQQSQGIVNQTKAGSKLFSQRVSAAPKTFSTDASLGINNKNVGVGKIAFNPQTKRFEEAYTTSAGNQYFTRAQADAEQNRIDDARERKLHPIETQLRDAYAERDRLEKLAKERMDQLDKEFNDKPWYLRALKLLHDGYETPYQHDEFARYDVDTKYSSYMAALRNINQLITTLEDKRDGKTNEFWHSFGTEAKNGYTFSFAGKNQILDAGILWKASLYADKINKKRNTGEPLTEDEQEAEEVLKAATWNNIVQGAYGDQYGAWARAGKSAAVAADFMIDFLMAGGGPASTAKGIYSGVVKGGTKLLGKFATKSLGKFALKSTGVTLGALAGGAQIANTVRLPKTMADAASLYTGDVFTDDKGNYVFGHFEEDENGKPKFVKGGESALGSILKAERSAITENAAELVGEFLPGSKILLKEMNNVGLRKISGFLTSIGNKNWYKNYTRALKTTGFHGIAGEAFEEYIGMGMDAMLGGDEWKNLDNLDTHIDIWLGCATMGGILGAPKVIGTGYSMAKYYKYKNDVGKSDKTCESLFNEKWGEMRDAIDNAENDKISSVVSNLLKSQENLNSEQAKALIGYAINLQRMRGYNIAMNNNEDNEEKDENAQALDESYAIGYNTSEAKGMRDLSIGLSEQRKRVEGIVGEGSDFMAVLDGAPDEALQYIRNSDLKEDEKKIVTDYVLQRNSYNAMNERINNDAEGQYISSVYTYSNKTNKQDGKLHQATLKEKSKDGTNKQVFIIDGEVVMNEDGTAVDTEKSDKTIVIYDTETGEKKQIDPASSLGIQSLGAVIGMDEIMQKAEDQKQQYIQQQMDIASGTIRLKVGEQVTLTSGENAMVVSIDQTGETAIVRNEKGEQMEVSRADLQAYADQQAIDEYKQRNGLQQEVTAEEPAAEPTQQGTEATAASANEQTTKTQGAPAEYKGGMTLTIRDEDGTEKEAKVEGRVRTVNNNGKLEYELDENGGIVQYIMDGEVHRDRIQDLNEKVVGYTSNEEEQQAAQTVQSVNAPREYKQGDRFMVSDGRKTFDAEIIAEENEDGLLTVQLEGNGETFVQMVSPTDLGALIDTYISQAAEASEPTTPQSVQQKYKKGDTFKIYDGEEAYEAKVEDAPNEEGLIPVRVKGKEGDYIEMFAPQTLDELTAPLEKITVEQPTAETPAAQTETPTNQPNQEEVSDAMPMTGSGDYAEPDFMRTTPQRGRKYIYEEAGLSRNEADQFVSNNIEAASKSLDRIKGKAPKMGTSLAKYNKDKDTWQQHISNAQATLDYWKSVKNEQDMLVLKEQEAQRKRDIAAHDAAVTQKQAEYEERKQAEEERKEVGNENPMPVITEKWNNSNKIDGHGDEIVLPNGERIKGHYVLHESGASSPSHNSQTWAKTEGFPMDANDNSVNDRDYEQDKDAQQVTRDIARQYDQRALQTPVVVSQDGVVLSGNGRTMAGELAARDNTDGAYIEYLKEYAHKYGFTPEQVSSMQHPRVSFVPDERMPYTAETFAKFNQQEMKSQNKTEQAVKLGKTVSDDVFKQIVSTINGYDTLGDFYADSNASLGAVYELRNAGVLSQAQMAEMIDGANGKERLSAVGRELLENMLLGKAFEGNPDVVRMLTEIPSMRQSVITALGEISANVSLGNGYSLQNELAEAVKLVYDARTSGNMQMDDIVSVYARQGVLFADPDQLQTVADFNNATMLMLADVLNDKRVTLLKSTLALYNNDAKLSAEGVQDMFEGGVRSRESILKDIINFINNNYGRNKKVETELKAAVERRKSASIQQDGAVTESGRDGEATVEDKRADGTISATPRLIDPREISDEERKKRGDKLRTAEAVYVSPKQIVATKDKSARNVAEEWWGNNVGEAKWYDTEAGEVEINRNSVESSLAHGYGQMKLDAITSLVDGFANAVYLGTMPDTERRETQNHYFAYPIKYNGKRCYVFCRALHDNNTNRLYVHEVFVEEGIKKGNTLQTAASKPHGGISLYRDILANVLEVSDGKGKQNKPQSETKQTETAESLPNNISEQIPAAEAETIAERIAMENEAKRVSSHFPIETREEAAAFDRRVHEMSDLELLSYIKADGNGDVNKAHHPNVYDEYDYRHEDEIVDAHDRYLQQLQDSNTTLEQAQERLGNIWKDLSQFATEERAELLGQEEALLDYIQELKKGEAPATSSAESLPNNISEQEEANNTSTENNKVTVSNENPQNRTEDPEKREKATPGNQFESILSSEEWPAFSAAMYAFGGDGSLDEKRSVLREAFSRFGDEHIMQLAGLYFNSASNKYSEQWQIDAIQAISELMLERGFELHTNTNGVKAGDIVLNKGTYLTDEFDKNGNIVFLEPSAHVVVGKNRTTITAKDSEGRVHHIARKDIKGYVRRVNIADTTAKSDGANTTTSAPSTAAQQVKAAEAETNTNPTEAQKQAGNYKKGHLKIDGFDVSIENPKGSVRRGTDASGKQWEQTMNNTYGYLRGTEGVDGDHIDVFLSDNPEQGDVFVVDQVNKDGTFDEHKVMYGFPTEESARQAYLANYEDGWQGLGAITSVSREEFKKWVQSSHRKTKPFAEYKGVKIKQTNTELPTHKAFTRYNNNEAGTIAMVSGDSKRGYLVRYWTAEANIDEEFAIGEQMLTPEEFAERLKSGKLTLATSETAQQQTPATENQDTSHKTADADQKATEAQEKQTQKSREENGTTALYQKSDIAEPVSRQEAALRDALVEFPREAGIEIVMDADGGQRMLDAVNGEVRMMGSRVDGRMEDVGLRLEGRELGVNEKAVVDVYSGKAKSGSVSVERDGKEHRVVMRQGTENRAGTKHSLLRHYSTGVGTITAEDLLLIPEVIERGEMEQNGKKRVYRLSKDGVRYTVLSEVNNGREEFCDFYSNRKGGDTSSSNTQTSARGYDVTTNSDAKVHEKSDTSKSNDAKLQKSAPSVNDVHKKQQQLQIINDTNPAPDDYHTWVRSTDDILTLSEAVDEVLREDPNYDLSSYPDVSDEMIRKALQTGRITIYSSNPIKNGAFVTPSLMQAQDYAGRGKAYSAEVNTSDVAWINTDEGMFASTSNAQPTSGGSTIRFFRTKDGHAYGFVKDGKIYIDHRTARADTPIHEYTHLWAEAFRTVNPDGWKDIVRLMKGTDLWQQVRRQYPELTAEDELAEEVLAHYSGRRGAERLRAEQERILNGDADIVEKAAAVSAIQRVKEALGKFWRGVADWLGIRFTTAEEVADRVLADMLHGVNPAKVARAKADGTFSSKNPDIRYQFVGEKGASAIDKSEEASVRLDNLAVAREMEAAGKDAKTVKLATGWERGADGKWRYEIEDGIFDITGQLHPERRRLSDSEKKELDDAFEETMKAFEKGSIAYKEEITEHTDMADIYEAGGMERKKAERIAYLEDKENKLMKMPKRLDDYLDNEALFSAYPELREMDIDTTEPEKAMFGLLGSYNPSENAIKLNDMSHDTLIHEVQHAIQHIEGFEIGGNKKGISDLYKTAKKEWQARKFAENLSEKRKELGGEVSQQKVYDALVEEYKESGLSLPSESVRAKGFNYFVRGHADASLDHIIKAFDLNNNHGANFDANKAYKNLSGEVEARNVQKRLGMTADERIASLASETEDVAREDQIFLQEGLGESTSASDVDVKLDEVNERFNEALSGLTEENKDRIILSLGRPSAVLLSAGVENRPMKLYGNKVIKKMKKHGFSLDELRNLPAAVAEPIAVFDNYKQKGNRTILTELQSRGNNIMVAITLGKDGVDVDFNIISSVFGKGDNNIVDWINKGYATYINKEKALNYLHHSDRSISEALSNPRLDSAAKVVESFENPKVVDGKVLDSGDRGDSGYQSSSDGKSVSYKSEGGEHVEWRSLFSDAEMRGVAPVFDPTGIRLRKLEDGEQCNVERRYIENGMFDFTGKERIESEADVAYIFRQLENSAVENSFLVLLKDGIPTVIHLGMGDYTSTVAPIEQAFVAYSKMNPDEVYFVHNHPSGNIKASTQDQRMMDHLRKLFGREVVKPGIIINTTSGKFGVFDSDINIEEDMQAEQQAVVPIRVYNFGKQVFASDWNPREAFKIRNSDDVASFISSHRLGEHDKMSLLVLGNDNSVVTNLFLPFTKIGDLANNDKLMEACDLIAGYVHQCGGIRCVVYGNYGYSHSEEKTLNRMAFRLKEMKAPLLDAIHITHSAREEGIVYEPNSEDMNIDAVNKRFNAELQKQIDGTLQDGHIYQLGLPSVILKSTGIPDLPIQMNSTRLKEKATTYGHDFSLSDVNGLVNALQEPVAVFAYGNKDKAQNVIVEIQRDGKNFVVGLSIRPTVNGRVLDINSIRNVFPKDNAEWLNWINQGKLLYADKEKIQTLIDQQRTILADVEYLDLDSAAKVVKDFENPSLPSENMEDTAAYRQKSGDESTKANSQTTALEKRNTAQQLAERLNTPISIVESTDEITHPIPAVQARRRRAKGWYDKRTGEVFIVLPNCESTEDVAATVAHETIAHKGLRELVGEERYDEFLYEVYSHLRGDLRQQVEAEATRTFIDDITKNGKRARSYEQHRRTATDELLGRMAEKPLEEFTEGERTLWQKIKEAARKIIDRFLGKLKLPGWFELGDNELRYILWRSKERLERGREHPIDLARDIVKREELGLSDDVYAMGDGSETFRERQRRAVANKGTVMPGLKDAEVKVVDVPRHDFTGTGKQALASAEKWAKENITGVHSYVHDGMKPFDYVISNKSIDKYLSATSVNNSENMGVHLSVLKKLPDVISESIETEEHADYTKGNDGKRSLVNPVNKKELIHRFYGSVSIDGKVYRVKTTIKEYSDASHGAKAYNYEVTKIELIDAPFTGVDDSSNQMAMTTTNSISVAKLLKDVEKSYDKGKKLLDESNSSEEETALYKDGDFQPRDRAIARDAYNRMVGSGMYQFQEAMQDSMLGLKRLYQSILGKDKRIEDVKGFENAYLAENRMSSVNAAEQHEYYVTFMNPLIAAVGELAGTNEAKRQELTDYMMAKHGLERNEVMADRDFQKYKSENPNGKKTLEYFRNRDYAGLTALTGKDNVADAEDAARLMVQDYEREHDTTELWNCVNAATSATLNKIFQSGLLSRENYEQIKQMYKNYIPLRGWDETTSDEVYGYLTSKNGPLGSSPIKRAEGRSSKADDPIATIALMADDAIRQGNRNLMKQTFLNFVLNNPSDLVSVGDLWLKYNDITDEWEPVFVDIEDGDTAEDISRKVEAFEARMEQLAKDDKAHYKRGRDAQNMPYKVVKNNINEHQVLVRRNGRTYVLTVNGNPRAAQALNGLTNPDVDTKGVIGNLLRSAERVNRFISAAYTTRNPDFVVSNFVRDLVYSNCMVWVKEGGEYAVLFHKNVGRVNPWSINKLFRKWNNGNLDESIYLERMFKAFMLGGGETGYTNIKDIEGHKREIAKELKRNGNKVSNAWAIFTKQLDLIGGSVENCARFAAFLTSREMGRSVERSIYDAKEISVNFNKKGSGGKMLGASGQTTLGNIGSYTSGAGRLLYIFWNAAIQGSTNFGRQVKRNPKKALTAMATMYILGSLAPILAKLIGGDDEDDKNAYYNLPENVRRSNLCLYAGDTWIKIALPVEFRAFYGLGELSSSVLTRGERYSNEELTYQIAGQVSQLFPIDMLEGGGGFKVFVPSLAKPIYEAEKNQSWTGLPIYKDTEWNKNDPEWTKVYQNANSHLVNLSKWANELTGGDDYKKGYIDINPAKIEHELSGYFGGAFSTIDKLVKMGETAFGEREFEWRNMLLANRVLATGDERTENRKLTNEYFKYNDMYEEVRRLQKHYEEASETDDKYKAKLALLRQSEEYTIFKVFDSYKPLFKALYDAKKDADETTLKRLEQEEHDLRREMVDLIHEIEDDKNPNIDGRVSSMLQREFEKNGETRKSAGARIAKNMGGKDTYGSPTTEYGKIYENKRDYIDLAEDVLLQSESKKAKDSGDKARYKRIESARRKLTEMRKGLERTPYEDSDGNIVTEEDVMNRIRTARRKIIQNLGLDK